MKPQDFIKEEKAGSGYNRSITDYVKNYLNPPVKKDQEANRDKVQADARAKLALEPLRQSGFAAQQAVPVSAYSFPVTVAGNQHPGNDKEFVGLLRDVNSIPADGKAPQDGVAYTGEELKKALLYIDKAIEQYSRISTEYPIKNSDGTVTWVFKHLAQTRQSQMFGTKNITFPQSKDQIPLNGRGEIENAAIILIHFQSSYYVKVPQVSGRTQVPGAHSTSASSPEELRALAQKLSTSQSPDEGPEGIKADVYDYWVAYIVPAINKTAQPLNHLALGANGKPLNSKYFNLGAMYDKANANIGRLAGQGPKTTAPLSRVGPQELLGLNRPPETIDNNFVTTKNPLPDTNPLQGRKYVGESAYQDVWKDIESAWGSSKNLDRQRTLKNIYDAVIGHGEKKSFPIQVDNLREGGITANSVWKNFMEIAHPLMLMAGNVRDNGVTAALKRYFDFDIKDATIVYPAGKTADLYDSVLMSPTGQWVMLSSKAFGHQAWGGAQAMTAGPFLKLFTKMIKTLKQNPKFAREYAKEIEFCEWLQGSTRFKDKQDNEYIQLARQYKLGKNTKPSDLAEDDEEDEYNEPVDLGNDDEDDEETTLSAKDKILIANTLGKINEMPKLSKFLTYVVNNGPLVQMDTHGQMEAKKDTAERTGIPNDTFILDSVIATWPNKLADKIQLEGKGKEIGFKLVRGGTLSNISKGIQQQIQAKGIDPDSPEGEALTQRKYDTLRKYNQRRTGRSDTYMSTAELTGKPITLPIGPEHSAATLDWSEFLTWFNKYIDDNRRKLNVRSMGKTEDVENLVKAVRPWQQRNGFDYEFENLLDSFLKLPEIDEIDIGDRVLPSVDEVIGNTTKSGKTKASFGKSKTSNKKPRANKTKISTSEAANDNEYAKSKAIEAFPNLLSGIDRYEIAKKIIGLVVNADDTDFEAFSNALIELLKDTRLVEILKKENQGLYDFVTANESSSYLAEGLKSVTYIRALTALYLAVKLRRDPGNKALFDKFITEISKLGSAGFRLKNSERNAIQQALIARSAQEGN